MDGFDLLLIGLNRQRDELYRRIERRVDAMLDQGLVAEVKKLLKRGLRENKTALQALGYKESVALLDGTLPHEAYVAELKKRTRNFARRQMTWFRRFKNVKWFNIDADFSPALLTSYIRDSINLAR